MGARVLLVEDEHRLAGFIQRGLVEEGFSIEVVERGEDALDRIRRTTYDLLVLDVMLPGLDGFSVCREVRALGVDVPILILSARGIVEDRVKGLELGADDYLPKPFAFSELNARVRALLRRRHPAGLRVLVVADLMLDPITRTVRRGARRIELTQKEFALLEFLMRNTGQVVTRTMIAEQVWGLTWERLTNVIDVYISHLRNKIEVTPEARLIHAVRGTGYVIREP